MNLTHDTTTQEYIELILDIERENRVARVKDIADRRGVSRSSVSIILNHLRQKNLIKHEHYSHVTLTEKGKNLALMLESRHQVLKAFFTNVLGIEETVAEKDACIFEHMISPETLDAISRFLLFIEKCPKVTAQSQILFRQCDKFNDQAVGCDDCELPKNDDPVD
ncbi:MAG TPA: metal-dependent transcriptional regulator [bacterium]|jgi:DtxR family Mn-dependent transcriptional regulator|nr:metal-dependent transcriptional regulator [bacterium]HNT65455.1 metal-dependent transcriptional regulator [bacterium]HOX87147.1 metal-dependent transcriptional regulator [bacterium]HPG46478.1 metal-dependent transcriptional regulator [bacterium]HPM98609.1 metal-dependent transcriptional regulator [bacterium]